MKLRACSTKELVKSIKTPARFVKKKREGTKIVKSGVKVGSSQWTPQKNNYKRIL